MRRSTVNQLMAAAESTFARHGYAPPPWLFWSPEDWTAHPEQARYRARHQMGWDVTDFGAGRFAERGLILVCTRNGLLGVAGERPYAEKIMIVGEGQETPYHFHKVKAEDIINRGGGDFAIELVNTDAGGRPVDTPVATLVDGALRHLAAREPLILKPGEGVTLLPCVAHRFYGVPGTGEVFVGEVSQLNDDCTDNYFLEPVGRFGAIEEDEASRRPLWSELAALLPNPDHGSRHGAEPVAPGPVLT